MTWREALAKADVYLSEKSVSEPRAAAELLAARLLKVGRGFLAGKLDETPTERELEAMRRGMRRLVTGEPVQYVLGEWDFRTLTLKCDRRALIPRPETEELVTRVLKHLSGRYAGASPVVVDVGTGTGAIILSIAREFTGDGVFIGTDLSAEALELARENASRCSLEKRVKFALADGLDDFDEPGTVDIIVSNPPYIESAECDRLDAAVKDWEPRMALDGGESGFDFYERYLGDAINVLKSGGAVFFEIGESQGPRLERLMFEFGFEDISVEKDFAGHDRYVSGVLP